MNQHLFKRGPRLALIGTVFATLGDAIHVHTHTLVYTHPSLFGQAWWVAPNFFITFMVMILTYALLVRLLPAGFTEQSTRPVSFAAFVETMATFFLVYLLSGFANGEPGLLCAIFYAGFVLRWLYTYDKPWLLLLSVLMAAGGMAAEGVLGAMGVVAYRHQDIFHVPWWLGGLYMHGAFALREGMRSLIYRD